VWMASGSGHPMEASCDPTRSGLTGAASVMGVSSSAPARTEAELSPADRERVLSRPRFIFDTGQQMTHLNNDDRPQTGRSLGASRKIGRRSEPGDPPRGGATMTKVGLLAKLEGVKAHVAECANPSAAILATGATTPFTGVVKKDANPQVRSSIGPNQRHSCPSPTTVWAA
jgi:hypothetical protein